MEGLTIFSAKLPLSPSANAANKRGRGGRVYKTQQVITFREKVANMINYYGRTLEDKPFAPYYIKYMDRASIDNNIWAYKRRDKVALAMRTKWRVVIHAFIREDRRDTDNFIKELIDAIFKAMGMNDKCVSSITIERIVNSECVLEHMAVVIKETDKTWKEDDLLRLTDLEMHLSDMEMHLGEQYNEIARSMDSERRIHSL